MADIAWGWPGSGPAVLEELPTALSVVVITVRYHVYRDCNFKGVTSGMEETPDDRCDNGRDPGACGPVGGG